MGTSRGTGAGGAAGSGATGHALIYKIAEAAAWEAATAAGRFDGAPVDLADGYIHFSTAEQVADTAAKHFAGRSDLVLVAVDTARLDPTPVYEASRGGALFPHLYAPLDLAAVAWVEPLPLGADGRHVFPPLGAEGAAR